MWAVGLAVAAFAVANARSRWARRWTVRALLLVFGVCYFVGLHVASDSGLSGWIVTHAENGPSYSALASVVLTLCVFVVMTTAMFVSEHRIAYRVLSQPPRPAGSLSPETIDAVSSLEEAGFTRTPDSPADLGGARVIVLSHPDGTAVDITETAGRSAAVHAEVRTRFRDGTVLRSQDQRYGMPRTIHRVHNASTGELIDAHRALVRERVAAGAIVDALSLDDELVRAWENSREDCAVLIQRPWVSAVTIFAQFVPGLRRLVL